MKRKMLRKDDCKGARLPPARYSDHSQPTRTTPKPPLAATSRTCGAKSSTRAPATPTSSPTRALTRRSDPVCMSSCVAWHTDGPQRIEHAGYHRYILQRNPPRYDADGDIVEVDDEYEEEEDDIEPVEENPYGDIQLESM